MSDRRGGCGGCLGNIIAIIVLLVALAWLASERAREGGGEIREMHTVDKAKR